MAEIRSVMVADVGARIRALRTARGMTQAQLADNAYTKAYVSMLESGRTRASMKALEHISGILGVTPADLLGGSPSPAAPQYDLIEARKLVEGGQAAEAVLLLEALEEGLPVADQLARFRYLAKAYNALGRAKQAFPILDRAQRMAELLDNKDAQVRVKAVLSNTYTLTYAYDEAIGLLKECVKACDDGVVKDPLFHFQTLVKLAALLNSQRQGKAALAALERALELSNRFSDRAGLATLYAEMAKAQKDRGDLQRAVGYNQRSLQAVEELELLDQVASTLDGASVLYAEAGSSERAAECLVRGARIAEQIGRTGTLASIKVSDAEVAAKRDPAKGLELAQEALKHARSADQPAAQVRALTLIGELRMGSSVSSAKKSFTDAVAIAEAQVPGALRGIYDRWSRSAEKSGDASEALRLARRALEVARV